LTYDLNFKLDLDKINSCVRYLGRRSLGSYIIIQTYGERERHTHQTGSWTWTTKVMIDNEY